MSNIKIMNHLFCIVNAEEFYYPQLGYGRRICIICGCDEQSHLSVLQRKALLKRMNVIFKEREREGKEKIESS